MTPAFLSPRPGELLYSALGRNAEAMGSTSPKTVMARLFGVPNVIATVDLPNNLARLVAGIPAAAGFTVERLAWEHTLLPYYTRFQPEDVRGRALEAMSGSGGSVHLLLGIPTFRTGRPSKLQFCPECLSDMVDQYGSPHWRIVHQLPGVLVCPDHRVRLRSSVVDLNATNRHEFVPAGEAVCGRACDPVTSSLRGEELDRAVEVAKASAGLLASTVSAVSTRADLRAWYFDALKRIGLLRGRLSVNQGELAHRLVGHWGRL